MNQAARPDRPGCPGRRGRFARSRRAYTLLELQVTLVILTSGVLAIAALLAAQGRQIRHVEQWCSAGATYYLVSQTNRWMRRVAAPAQVETEAGVSAWTPTVTGEAEYQVQLTALSQDLQSRSLQAEVNLVELED